MSLLFCNLSIHGSINECGALNHSSPGAKSSLSRSRGLFCLQAFYSPVEVTVKKGCLSLSGALCRSGLWGSQCLFISGPPSLLQSKFHPHFPGHLPPSHSALPFGNRYCTHSSWLPLVTTKVLKKHQAE